MRAMGYVGPAGLCALILMGCEGVPGRPAGPEVLALTGEGYPRSEDPCQISAAKPVDLDFVNAAATMFACPPGVDLSFVRRSPYVVWLGNVEGWTVYAWQP